MTKPDIRIGNTYVGPDGASRRVLDVHDAPLLPSTFTVEWKGQDGEGRESQGFTDLDVFAEWAERVQI